MGPRRDVLCVRPCARAANDHQALVLIGLVRIHVASFAVLIRPLCRTSQQMARWMIMNRVSRMWLTVAVSGIAVLGVLTACSGSHENTAPRGDSMTTAPAAGLQDG